ncbi:MAG: RNA polymerase sigma-70 factor (ECF subfamily) [Glaciecola sp.]
MSASKKQRIAELANQHGRQVFQSAFRLLSDVHQAEDITQEVFLKLFNKSEDGLAQVDNWGAYLRSMSISTAIDLLRKQKRQGEDALETNSELISPSAAQPSQQLMTSRDMAAFADALKYVKAQDAEIFCMRFVEGYSYQEIAKVFDISQSLVGVRLHRCQQELLSRVGHSQSLGDSYAV